MAVLHLVSNPNATASCLRAAAAGDAVVFLGDGVFSVTAPVASAARVGVLTDDADSRGVHAETRCERLSQADFVAWVVAYKTSVTWR